MSVPANRRLLFFSPLLAMPDQHGGCVYPYAVLAELHRQGVAIDYAWLSAPLGKRRVMRNPLTGGFVTRGWVRGTLGLSGLLIPDSLAGWFGRSADAGTGGKGEQLPLLAEQTFAAQMIRRSGATAILVDGTYSLPILDRLSPAERARLRVGVLTHNLNCRRTDLYRAHHQPLDFLPMTAAEETALLERADVVIAIQDREAEAFRSMLPGRRVITVPMPIQPHPQPPNREIPGRCVFVGGFSGHNIEALHWLLRDIWPRVLAAQPAAELAVAGTVCQAITNAPAGVRLLGPLSDLDAFYATAAVSLVPLAMGTGLKIKLVEAMGRGRAVVTTAAGAEGFPELEAGEVAVVADEAVDFSAAVLKLLAGSAWRREVAQRQLAWIAHRLAPADVVAPLRELWAPAAAPAQAAH
ncbi:MAG: glycosyltransferase family 4 protein [Opitutaceae bacterium]